MKATFFEKTSSYIWPEYFKQYTQMKTIKTSHVIMMMIVLLPMFGKTQLVTISGNITNSESGKALENVNIFESISNIGTITNEKGFFKLVLSRGVLEIEITKNGFNKFAKHLILKNDTILNLKLDPEIQHKNRTKWLGHLHADSKTSNKNSDRRVFK